MSRLFSYVFVCLFEQIDFENQQSIISRFEKKEKDIEKLVQAKENELKLAQSFADERERQNCELKCQLRDIQMQFDGLNRSQESSKGLFSSYFI